MTTRKRETRSRDSTGQPWHKAGHDDEIDTAREFAVDCELRSGRLSEAASDGASMDHRTRTDVRRGDAATAVPRKEVGDRTREMLSDARQRHWLRENRGALSDANEFLSRHGLWSDGRRQL
jgi:hypothetical protein